MKLNQENIGHIYETINNIFLLNFIIIYDDNKIMRLKNIDLPENIKNDEIEMIKYISNKSPLNYKNKVIYFESIKKLKYIVFNIFYKEKYEGDIIIGPYINYPTQLDIKDQEGRQFDKIIPIIKGVQEKSIENIVMAIINSEVENLNIEFIQQDKDDVKYDNYYGTKEFDMGVVNIRERYRIENKILHYVSLGDEKKAIEMIAKNRIFNFERFPDQPVRNLKNFAITMNTLLRKAVQENNIDPYFLDGISDYFAKKIEKSNNIDFLSNIFEYMVKEYCSLVKVYNTKGYSQLVSNAINFIKLNFKYEIGLSSISKELFVHPTYLAKKFKSETNKTLSEYINEIRIKDAKFMLKTTEFKIEDIAYHVGFNDKKYFSKVFKKIQNQSPSEYRKYS